MSRVKDRIRNRARSFLGQQELNARLDRQLARIEEAERELARIGPQLAALEARLETLRERVDRRRLPVPRREAEAEGTTASTVTEDELRSLHDELARQQEQVRARISAAARFEERLRRVEDALGVSP